MKKERVKTSIRLPEKLGYAGISVVDNLRGSFKGTFMLFFGTNVLGIRPGLMGIISSIMVIWDAINDPLMAYYADNHPNRNGDRCRQYLFAGIPMGIVSVLMFMRFSDNPMTSALILLLLNFLYDVFVTLHRLPFYSMMILVSPKEEDRISVNKWHFFGTGIGTALGSVLMWPLVRAFGGVDGSGNLIDPERGFFLGSVIVAAAVILVSVYHYFTTKERVHPQNAAEKPFLESVKILFRNGHFCRNVVMFFFVQTIISAIVGYGLYYATYVLGNAGMLTLLNVVYLLSNMLIIPFVNKFIRKLGRNKTIIVSSIILILGELVFLSMPKTLTGAITLVLAAGFATSMFNMVVTLNRADIADEVERTEGCRSDSMISNVSGFAVKCASSLVSLLFGWVLEFTHYDATLDVQPQSAVNGILFILGWFVVICSIGMILSTPRDRKVKAK